LYFYLLNFFIFFILLNFELLFLTIKFVIDWDFFNKQLEDLKLSDKEKDLIRKDVQHKEAEYLRMQ
jgi:hypothetical protein